MDCIAALGVESPDRAGCIRVLGEHWSLVQTQACLNDSVIEEQRGMRLLTAHLGLVKPKSLDKSGDIRSEVLSC